MHKLMGENAKDRHRVGLVGLQRDNQGETAATIRMRDDAGQPSGEGRA